MKDVNVVNVVEEDVLCFYCVATRVEKQDYSPARKAVTVFNGTAVCAVHAYELSKRAVRDWELIGA